VRRTNELTLDNAGNEDFSYSQFIVLPLIPPLWLIFTILTMFIMMFASRISFVKKILMKRHFTDGGPNKVQRATSSFDFWAHGIDGSKTKKTIHSHCPGPYDTTAICAAEAAFALVNDREQLKPLFGVVTPGAVMASQMLQRLPRKGCSFDFE